MSFPRAIRRHITSKLDELNTISDAGRGVECRYIGAYTAALAAEIHVFSVAFDGPTSMQTHTNTPTHSGDEIIIKLDKPTLLANVLGVFLSGTCLQLTAR